MKLTISCHLLKSYLFTPLVDTLYTVSVTCKFLNFYKHCLIKYLTVPFVLFMVFAVVSSHYDLHPLLSVFVLVVLMMKNAVIIHRLILLGPDSVDASSVFKLNRRDVNYVAFQFMTILVVMMVPVIILTITSTFFNENTWPNSSAEEAISVFQWLGYYLVARISLLFPLLAIDKRSTLRKLWEVSKRYQIMLFGTVAVIPYFMTLMFDFVTPTNKAPWFSMLTLLMVSLFTAAMLSVVFNRIKEESGYYN